MVKEQVCFSYKGDEVGEDWIQSDFCDGWYHENCSGLPEVIISQLLQANYLLFRCSLCLDNKKVEETTRKRIKDTIQEMLPSIMETAWEKPIIIIIPSFQTHSEKQDITRGFSYLASNDTRLTTSLRNNRRHCVIQPHYSHNRARETDQQRKLFSLPLKHGGLNIIMPKDRKIDSRQSQEFSKCLDENDPVEADRLQSEALTRHRKRRKHNMERTIEELRETMTDDERYVMALAYEKGASNWLAALTSNGTAITSRRNI